MQFPGSMRLSTKTFLDVFREVCDSLAHPSRTSSR
jgi:creatinine amidohydrolase/Fe(II)-dependent formamide hydrolase-like protein